MIKQEPPVKQVCQSRTHTVPTFHFLKVIQIPIGLHVDKKIIKFSVNCGSKQLKICFNLQNQLNVKNVSTKMSL